MRHYHDYKKPFRTYGPILIGVLAFIPFLFSVPTGRQVAAQTAQELQNKINEKNTDISRLEQEIASYQKELNDLSKQKSSLSSSVKALDLTRKKLVADIGITESKIEKTNFKIQALSGDISNKEDSISINTDAIASDIKETSEFEETTIVETLLSAEDFTLAWNDIDNRLVLRERIREQIKKLKEDKVVLEVDRDETIAAKNELLGLKSKLADQKKIVDQNTKEKQKLLAQTKNNEANYQKVLKDRLAQKDALEKEMREYESQLTYILDPSKLPQAGVLSWPLDNVYVTQLFGKTVASKRLYASGSHSGVDFRAAVGTPVKAMASGVVAGVGDTDTVCPGASFGKFVFIKYDNGLASAYGHLSLAKASVGDRVSRGEVVAYSGNTGYSTGPHLHVTLYAPNSAEVRTLPSKSCPGKILTQPIAATNAYLDAMYYLPPYK